MQARVRILTAVAFLAASASADAPRLAGPVLYLGDSHSTVGFGDSMDAWLRKNVSPDVRSFASCNTRPEDWNHEEADGNPRRGRTTCGYWEHDGAKPKAFPIWSRKASVAEKAAALKHVTPKVEDLLDPKPGLVVIQWGTNILGVGKTALCTRLKATLTKLSAVGPACLWIGAPKITEITDWRTGKPWDPIRVAGMLARSDHDLKAVVEDPEASCPVQFPKDGPAHARCTYIQSSDVSGNPDSLAGHFQDGTARGWAHEIQARMVPALRKLGVPVAQPAAPVTRPVITHPQVETTSHREEE